MPKSLEWGTELWNRILDDCYLDENDCWIWEGYTNGPTGRERPRIRYKYKLYSVHRIMYCLHNNIHISDLPVDNTGKHQINHVCRVSMCVNPHHLYVGTQRDNMLDERDNNNLYNQILTWDDVNEIRRMATDGHSLRHISEVFDIGYQHTRDIVAMKIWTGKSRTV